MYIEVKKKNDGKYEVNPNATPSVGGNIMGAAISSYETAYCFMNVMEEPLLPKHGEDYSNYAPTSESFEIWDTITTGWDCNYSQDSHALFAGRPDNIMFTNGNSGYAIMKVGDKIWATYPNDNDFNEGFEITLDPNVEIPIVTNDSGVPYTANQLNVITDTNNYHIKYSGSEYGFFSITTYTFESCPSDTEYSPPGDSTLYQYITVGAFDSNNRTINFARYVLQGID